MNKAIGFCNNYNCDQFAKGIFLLYHEGDFFCPSCAKLGEFKRESRTEYGEGGVYREVKVEFGYNRTSDMYASIAVVSINEIKEGKTYVIQSPLILTENRALKVAANILCSLNSGVVDPATNCPGEIIINLDDPGYSDNLKKMKVLLEKRERFFYGN